MWSSRLFWKIFLVTAGFNLALVAGLLIFVTRWQDQQVMGQVRRHLQDTAVMLRSHVVELGLEEVQSAEFQRLLEQLAATTQMRMSLIARDGRVLADSDKSADKLENHRDRPELLQAAEQGVGIANRHSRSVGKPMLYVALPLEREGAITAFVRVAADTQPIEAEMASVRNLLWLFALVMLSVALMLTYALVGRIIRPLGELIEGAQAIAVGDFNHPVSSDGQDELAALGGAFTRMQRELAQRVRELEQNGQRLETVLGSMVEGVIAVDAQQCVLLANQASKKLLELHNTDIVGRPLLEITRSRAMHAAVADALSSPRASKVEFEVVGETRRILSLRATRLPGRTTPGAVVVLHDVTELRRLENMRREFVANVSHELKTPLASIKAYAETLQLGAVNDPQHNLAFVGRIEEQADRLHQLIVDLIHLARVESGQEVFEIVEVSVAEVVANCAAQHTGAADAKQIVLVVEPPDEALQVRADEEGLRTIFDNLVGNAIKYSPAGGRVVIRWRRDGEQVLLEVEDNGIGIARKHQDRVFERFYRVDKARSRELGGTGLGLSIVKHLAQAFGGGVGLISEVGEGSTFQIRLPRG